MTDLPKKLRALADTLIGDEWQHPLAAVETCQQAADELERLMAFKVILFGHDKVDLLQPAIRKR
jgi:hypothetical protein